MKNTGFLITGFLLILTIFSGISCKEKPDDNQDDDISVLKPHKIIPLPTKVTISGEELIIMDNSNLFVHNSFQRAGQIVTNAFSKNFGFSLISNTDDIDNSVIRIVFDENLEDSEYKIEIDQEKVLLKAKSSEGAFYAAQTFRQILWNADMDTNSTKVEIQIINVSDKSQNSYRGFHIDLSRHFFPKEFVFKIIDQMALYKLNKLQLHLTDDQGWRIQLDKYSKLTSIGAYREFNDYDLACIEKAKYDADYNFNPNYVNGNTYGGFYTKQDIRELIAYATENFIDVIPEIDMPGHMSAAIRSYPELGLSCSGNTDWGDEFSEPLCVCKPDVMQFAFDVWDEVMELFPYEYVHLGADEVEKSFWKESTLCQQFMADNNMTHVNKIQSYFVDEMYKHISSKGKKMIAWDDIFVSNDDNIVNTVNPDINIMYWRDYKPEASVYAAQNGNPIILTPWSWFYLSSDPTDENLKSLYEFDEGSELSAGVKGNKIGYQACVWTEVIPSGAVFERYIFPRFQAYAEVAWSNAKAWDSFIKRMPAHIDYLEKKEIKYTKSNYFK
ncbi:MAG: beta-N-acetylhexosaminidase [Bacteroidota bacterium]